MIAGREAAALTDAPKQRADTRHVVERRLIRLLGSQELEQELARVREGSVRLVKPLCSQQHSAQVQERFSLDMEEMSVVGWSWFHGSSLSCVWKGGGRRERPGQRVHQHVRR